jgi:flagellar biosynthesis protein FlhB
MDVVFEMTIKVGIALFLMAVADFAYQKWKHDKDLRMTKQEVKDENKQQENPELKGRIRGAQRQLASKRMMAAVPEATVVVTNPTHIAVALKYEPTTSTDAPKVVAKGKLKIAEKIIKIARDHEVPVIQNKPLAWGLYDSCELGMEIPLNYYQTVAEILSQIYQANKNKYKSLTGTLNGS